MSAWQPATWRRSTSPGTARTGMRPAAQLAVLSAPLRAGASITTTASASAATIALRARNCQGCGGRRAGTARARRRPPRACARPAPGCGAGRISGGRRPARRPSGASAASAPSWAAASMPRARPETMQQPARPSSRAKLVREPPPVRRCGPRADQRHARAAQPLERSRSSTGRRPAQANSRSPRRASKRSRVV